jgi:hypothetical protein
MYGLINGKAAAGWPTLRLLEKAVGVDRPQDARVYKRG